MTQITNASGVFGQVNTGSGTNYSVNVNLPTTPTVAGFWQGVNYAGGTVRVDKVTDHGDEYAATGRMLMNYQFNTTASGLNPIFGINNTTMTIAASGLFTRLNANNTSTATTGAAIYTQKVFKVEDGSDLHVIIDLKHTDAKAPNKQAEFGLGYYNFAAGQANQMNEFIGFRWFNGALLGVLIESTGSTPAEQTIPINGGHPYSDNVFREYEMFITDTTVEFWVSGIYQGSLIRSFNDSSIIKAIAYPFICRVFNSAATNTRAFWDIAQFNIFKYGGEEDLSYAARQSLMGKSTFYAQPDITTISTSPHQFYTSGFIPAATLPANNASALNTTLQLGGQYALQASTISATGDSNYLVVAYQNPGMPLIAGTHRNSRTLIVTSISISRQLVTTTLAGGGHSCIWFVGTGGSAVDLATADANGDATISTLASRQVPLSTIDLFSAANTVAGTMGVRSGDSTHQFITPLIIHPGQFLHIGFRTQWVNAGYTAGVITGGVYVNGYWE